MYIMYNVHVHVHVYTACIYMYMYYTASNCFDTNQTLIYQMFQSILKTLFSGNVKQSYEHRKSQHT